MNNIYKINNQDNDIILNDFGDIIELYELDEIKENIKNNFNNEIIKQNYLMANELIPEMIVPCELIYLNGKINDHNVNILFDCGASGCTMNKELMDKLNLDYLVDKKNTVNIIGFNSNNKAYGIIWYLDLEIKINNNKYINLPINCVINNNNNDNIDIILGINFMKVYNVKINFKKRTISLNDSIIINYT
jgi:hypothetical protein